MADGQMKLDAAARAALDKLAEIVVPAPVPWTPQTWGWAVLAVVAAVACVWGCVRWRRQGTANRYRQQALAELRRLEAQLDDPAGRASALAALPVLLKRTALAVWPRTRVAPLTGRTWVEFLRAHGGGAAIPDATARLLEEGEYADRARLASMHGDEARACVRAVRDWIENHRVSA